MYSKIKTKLENLFKHKVHFNLKREKWIKNWYENGLTKYIEVYEVEKIKLIDGIVGNIVDDILPFINYLQSLHDKKKDYTYIGSTYYLRANDNCFEFICYDNEVKFFLYDNRSLYSMDDSPPEEATLNAHHYYGKGVIRDYNNRFRYMFVGPPLEEDSTILDAHHYYKLMEVKKNKLGNCFSNFYEIDQCVICLETKPNILFAGCNHICICSECEKIKPLVKCPYCRTKISRRIKISKIIFFLLFCS